jgi:hypothetical protein
LIEDSVLNLDPDTYSKMVELAIQYPLALTKSSKKIKNRKLFTNILEPLNDLVKFSKDLNLYHPKIPTNY